MKNCHWSAFCLLLTTLFLNHNLVFSQGTTDGLSRVSMDNYNNINYTIATEGIFNVSDIGSATYNIPIKTEKTLSGINPEISITYNSHLGNGMLGWGFSLSGLSTITRGQKNVFYDGRPERFSFSHTDAFYLDNKRLILTEYALGSDSAIYCLEDNRHARIVLHGLNGSARNQWFSVKLNDGNIYEYGNGDGVLKYLTPYSTDWRVMAWHITKVENSIGNYLTFEYFEEKKCIYPEYVKYGNKNDLIGKVAIFFDYEEREDTLRMAFEGADGFVVKRLKQIDTPIRTYKLNYDNTGDQNEAKISRLLTITECKPSGEQLEPTAFSWNYLPSFSEQTRNPQFANITTGAFDHNNCFYNSCDLNGDGLTDVVEMRKTKVDDEYENKVVISFASKDSSGNVKFNKYHSISLPNDYYSDEWADIRTSPMPIDLDGDGIMELTVPHRVKNDSCDYVEFQVLTTSGLTSGIRYNLSGHDFIYDVADLNNDGNSEIFVIKKGSAGVSSAAIIGGNSISFNYIRNVTLSISDNATGLHLTDVNRDGIADAVVFYPNRYAIYLNDGDWANHTESMYISSSAGSNLPITVNNTFIGDFNGDAIADFLLTSIDNLTLYIADFKDNNLLQCDKLTMVDVNSGFGRYSTTDANYQIYDFDADGKTDVVINKYANNTSSTYWYRSRGTSLEFVKKATSRKKTDMLYQHYLVGDFNGDGLYELANKGYDCYNDLNADISPTFHIYYNNIDYANTGRISSITNGLGAKTEINYKPMSDSTVYRRNILNLHYPVVDKIMPLSLVASVSTTGGAIADENINYSYKSMRFHMHGRGFLGAMSKKVVNTTKGTISEWNIRNWSSETFMPTETLETHSNDGLTKIKRCYYDSNLDEDSITSHLLTRTEDTDAIGNTTISCFNYDEFGNLTVLTQTEADSSKIINRYLNHVYIGNKYRPEITENERKYFNSNEIYIQRTSTEYDNKGQEKTVVENYGTNLPITTTYTYDSYGNIKSQSITGTGVNASTQYFDYDETNRLLIRKYTTGYPRIKISYAYDYWGNLISVIDSTRSSCPQTTTYTYDPWGRILSETLPTGQRKTYRYGLGGTLDERYSILEQGTGMPWKETWYDIHGREVRQETVGAYDVPITIVNNYNNRGLLSHVTKSVDYVETTTNYTYDAIDRVLSESTNTGQSKTYSYSGNTVTSTIDGKSYSATYDSWGNVIETSGPDGTMSYMYHSCGKPISITSNGSTVTMEYDDCGNQTKLTDPDAGIMTYAYDALGRVTTERDASGNTTTYSYNKFGKISSVKVNNDYQTSYSYPTLGNNTGLLTSITCNSDRTYKIDYTYDAYNRVTKEVHNIPNSSLLGTSITYNYTYNTDGLLETMTYPGNVTVRYSYDSYGNKISTSLNGQNVWALEVTDGYETTVNRGPNLTSTERLDMNGNLIYSDIAYNGSILHQMAYTHNANTGNVLSRTGMYASKENFTYDDADRLTGVSGGMTAEYRYAPNGNITFMTGMGNFAYESSKPHAVTGVENTTGQIDRSTLYTTYNSIGKISTIHDPESGFRMNFNYGPDNARCDALLYNGFDTIQHITYIPGCDIVSEKDQDGEYFHQWYYYIGDGAVYYRDSYGNTDTYYTYTDNIGSITRIYDGNGDLQFSAKYDPWGKRTNVTNNIGLIRGYTGHEHIWPFGLINMNGRLYDPLVGRFLSTDNFVQEPLNAQNFNRYSYCLNNPLKYNDPSGDFFIFSAITAVTDVIGNIFKHGINFSQYNWQKTTNAWKIDMGMFKGNLGQIINKWTWGLYNSVIGNTVAHYLNVIGRVDEVTDMDGMLALSGVTDEDGGAFTIGHYSFGPPKYKADWRDHLFVHEYGHYIQSQHMGLLYLPIIAPASLISAAIGESTTGTEHKNRWFEVWASSLGSEYFDKKYGKYKSGYSIGHKDYFDIESFRKSGNSPYINPRKGNTNQGKYFPTSDPTFTFWDFLIF